jgi:hypothetical protein
MENDSAFASCSIKPLHDYWPLLAAGGLAFQAAETSRQQGDLSKA